MAPEKLDGISIYLLSKLGQRAATAAAEALAPRGLRPREFSTLVQVEELGECAQGDVADRLGIDRSDMVSVVDKLEEMTLLSRAQDPTDRRRHVVEITAAGRRLLGSALDDLTAANADFLAPLSKSDARRLLVILTAMSRS